MAVITDFRSKKLIYHHSVSARGEEDKFTLHTHSVPELMFFVRGKATQMIEDRVYEMHSGDLIYVHPAVHHRVDPDLSEEYERYVFMFDEDIIAGTGGEIIFDTTAAVNCPQGSMIPLIIRKFDYYRRNFSDEAFFELATILLREIFFNLSKIDATDTDSKTLVSPLLSGALSYINSNLYTIKKVSEISDALYITESYLHSIFKQQLRSTPKKYINDKRLLAARNAIREGNRPTDIYREFGFSEYSTFYRSYVNLFGYPPSKKNASQAITVQGENR